MIKIERKTYLYKEIIKGLKSNYIDGIVITRKRKGNIFGKKLMYMISSNIKENEETYFKLFKEKSEYIFNNILDNINFCNNHYVQSLSLSNGTKIYIVLKKDISFEKIKYICSCIAISLADYVVVNKIDNISEAMQELDIALDLGKEIYAIPGNIFEYKNYLSNFAIKQGAIPICSVHDVNNIT